MLARALIACVAALFATTAGAEITAARFADPTRRYDHAILGDAVEWGALILTVDGRTRRLVLPETRVFEDLAPRLIDVDGDGAPEAIVVETDLRKGARLSVYGARGLIAATPFIGRTHRWLAPVGAADLDGDGTVELAYVDRPHLARTLRLWRFGNGTLTEIASRDGLTNHQIGWDYILGGIRDCGAGPEMLTADADWSHMMASSFDGNAITSREIGAFTGRDGFDDALACR